MERPPVLIDEMIVPPEAFGVSCISMGFFVQEDQPVIWRGPMLHKALEQFLTDVYWDDPDFLVVDLPPGTGDISLSLAQFLPRAELYVVTTPQPAAQRVAQRAAFMAHKVNLEVKGVIENMSWFTGDDGKRYEIFGSGGGDELAARLEVPMLAKVPLVPELREGGDAGPADHGDRPRVRGGNGVHGSGPPGGRGARPHPSITSGAQDHLSSVVRGLGAGEAPRSATPRPAPQHRPGGPPVQAVQLADALAEHRPVEPLRRERPVGIGDLPTTATSPRSS